MTCITELFSHKALAWLTTISAAVGLLHLVFSGISLVGMLLDLWVLPGRNLAVYGSKKGAWAVITGASDGIGKEYALQLAKKGFNVALISRTQAKLDALKADIEAKYRVQVKVLAFDASAADTAPLARFVESLDNVTVLINNVGQSHAMPVPFLETPAREQHDIVQINVNSTLSTTQLVAPRILATVRAKKVAQRGLILTMGSFAGLVPTPLLATYTGSKAFLNAWSSALAAELAPEHVDVELVLSYLVTSAMSKVRRTSWLIPNPKQFVAAALGSIGRRSGAQERYATSTPYWSHAALHWAINTFVGVYSKLAIGANLTMHKDIRRRALKKAERERKNL